MDRNAKLPETEEGTILFNTDPIIVKHHYEIDYLHSYAQDSPFFAGLAQKKLLGSRCTACGYCMPCPHHINVGASLAYYNAFKYMNLGEADIDRSRPLAGTLQGNYSTNEIHFVNVTLSWKF